MLGHFKTLVKRLFETYFADDARDLNTVRKEGMKDEN
jgi:hypothetical protein